jgi:hypothetical protein
MTVPDTAKLSSASVIVRRDGIVEAEVDGEVVALDIESGNCYGLNKVGTRIWQIIAAPQRVDALCTRLVGEYEIDLATCERDVLGLLEELLHERLIDVVAAAA